MPGRWTGIVLPDAETEGVIFSQFIVSVPAIAGDADLPTAIPLASLAGRVKHGRGHIQNKGDEQ